MHLAFIPECTVPAIRSRTSSIFPRSSLHGRRLRVPTTTVAPVKRASLRHSACATVKKDPKAVGDEEEEVLDEAAMRAAEIHEVLTGLKDFKNRIIDDATKLAKKVKAPKKQLEAALASHPDILKIDGHIKELEEELKLLGDR